MADKALIEAFLEMYNLMQSYNLTWYRKNFSGLDPQQGQGRILSAMRNMHIVTQKELGIILDIRPQSLGELLQKLEAHGYIKRYRSKKDKRALVVELTEMGETFQLQRPNYDELFDDLTAEERNALKRSLKKISAQLNRIIEIEAEKELLELITGNNDNASLVSGS